MDVQCLHIFQDLGLSFLLPQFPHLQNSKNSTALPPTGVEDKYFKDYGVLRCLWWALDRPTLTCALQWHFNP